MPLRGSVREAKAFAERNGALDRGAAKRCRRRSRSPTASSSRCAACRTASCIAPARAARCGPKPATATAALRRRRRRASRAPRARFPQARGRRDLDAASRRYAALLGVTLKRVSVRDQVSRWGSCTAAGVLSYSWRLILAPPLRARLSGGARGRASDRDESLAPVLARWSQRICPDWQRAKGWLNAQGNALHRYGEVVRHTPL